MCGRTFVSYHTLLSTSWPRVFALLVAGFEMMYTESDREYVLDFDKLDATTPAGE